MFFYSFNKILLGSTHYSNVYESGKSAYEYLMEKQGWENVEVTNEKKDVLKELKKIRERIKMVE